MGEWNPVLVLPNIELTTSIEGEQAVLAAADDERLVALRKLRPNFAKFISRFTDAFRAKLAPVVLVVRADAPKSFYDIEALASFRNAIAIATIAHSRARSLTYRRRSGVLFGNTFAFYPWMTDRDDEDLLAITPALRALHEVKKFRGQSSPELARKRLDPTEIDQPLLSELMNRWRRCFADSPSEQGDTALFRSLNMAYHGSLLPAVTEMTFYDVGRLIALWVSAFEILVHPGGNGEANTKKVFTLLERIEYERSQCKLREFETGGKSKKVNRNIACFIYKLLYDRRCDFLHGNPVDTDALKLPVSGQNVFKYASPLYRMALTAFLPVIFTAAPGSMSDPEVFGKYVADHSSFSRYQKAYEDALLTAMERPAGP